MRRAFAFPLILLLVAALAGCGVPEPAPAKMRVEPPDGEGWLPCPPTASRGLAMPVRVEAWESAEGRGPGVSRLDARTFLWVWADFRDTLREDRITRLNPVEVAVDGAGVTHVCARVDLSTPIEVDDEPRSYAVAARIVVGRDLPDAPTNVVVNWIAGCACDELPKGHADARFEACDGNASCF